MGDAVHFKDGTHNNLWITFGALVRFRVGSGLISTSPSR